MEAIEAECRRQFVEMMPREEAAAERLEHELRRLEPPRDVEVARDELVHATDRRTSAQVGAGKRIITCASVRMSPDGEAASRPDGALGSVSAVPVARSATGAVASKS